MPDPHSPRPAALAVGLWLAMVVSAFSLISAGLMIAALAVLREGPGDLPWGSPSVAAIHVLAVGALVWSAVALYVATLVWRRVEVARWLLLAGCIAGAFCWPLLGRSGAVWGVPAVITGLTLLLPGTTDWLRGRRVGTRTRVPVDRCPWQVRLGALTALVGYLLALAPMVRLLALLVDADLIEEDPRVLDVADPVSLQSWGLAFALLAMAVFLCLALAAFVALDRAPAARLTLLVAAGVELGLAVGQPLLHPVDDVGTLALTGGMLLHAVVPLLLLSQPAANRWYRAPSREGPAVEPARPAVDAADAPVPGGSLPG